MSTSRIDSRKLTIKEIIDDDLRFNIPIYQRLYVWGEEQVKTLIGDLQNAYKQESDKFYLGGIMLSKNNDKYDLIDGQQRFTTLWLLGTILGNDLEKFTYINIDKISQSRISFSVRDFANNYFNSNAQVLSLSDEEKEELKQIDEAKKIIENYLLEENIDKAKFSKFIFEKVLFIATEMPADTDENKVFEAMNNRGVQLQQHEILKTWLLKIISNNELRNKYGLLWDACSIMDNYLERNIKVVANLQWKKLFSTNIEGEKIVELPDNILERIGCYDENESITLLQILKDEISDEDKSRLDEHSLKTIKEEEYDGGNVRSIITFPMLLLHTLRIYEFRFIGLLNSELSAEVKGKDLIRIFESKEYFKKQVDIEKFISLLWDIRKQFDRFVIKWVSNEDNSEESHIIKKLYQNENSFQRVEPKKNESFALLQSMLYHSQQIITFYWLTPFLNKLLDEQDTDVLLEYLEHLDNEMFCNEKRDLRTMSYELLGKSTTELHGSVDYVKAELLSHKGTIYPSYWFYKLEYILWNNRDNLNKKEVWEDYKMTAKNSVEHISPQHPKLEDTNIVYSHTDTDAVKESKKDDFGNLVLLSPGMNSEYSNKTFNVKRSEFKDKKRLDSLKSDLIFDNNEWNWGLCENHRSVVIKEYITYLNNR